MGHVGLSDVIRGHSRYQIIEKPWFALIIYYNVHYIKYKCITAFTYKTCVIHVL